MAQNGAKVKTLADVKTKLDSIVANFGGNMKALGETLLDAKKVLTGEEYEEALDHLKYRGLTKADIEAALGVAQGKLEPELFFQGVKSSKIMTLKPIDRKRLMSDEKFPIKTIMGTEFKTWRNMTSHERNRLLGPKGGSIRTLTQQDEPSGHKRGGIERRIKQAQTAQYREGVLVLKSGATEMEVPTGLLKVELDDEQLGGLIADLQP